MLEFKYISEVLQAAVEASDVIMEFYNSAFETTLKGDGSPVTQADIASSNTIKSILKNTDLPIIDEESDEIEFEIRKNWKSFWCVDPLDGTKEFISKNGEFAINIALIENNKPVFGLIASPVNREILIGWKKNGVFQLDFESIHNPEKWLRLSPTTPSQFCIIGSRSHNSGLTKDFIDGLAKKYGDFKVLQKGSSLKFFDLATSRATIYPRFAPTMEWDIAAGQAILEELGGKVIDARSYHALTYNKIDLRNPSFIALNEFYINDFIPE